MLVLRVIVLFLMYSDLSGQSYQNMTRLKRNLLQNYTKSNRPLRNQTDTLKVYIDIYVRSIKEFNVFEGVLGTHLLVTLRWTDKYIRWDKGDYDNITGIKLPLPDVWAPNMVLLNPANNFDFLSSDRLPMFLVRYSSDGLASLHFATYLESTCKASIKYFPHDTHICHVMLSLLGDNTDEIVFVPSYVNPKETVDGGSWLVREVNVTEKFLVPEEKTYQYVDLSIKFKRHATFLTLNLFIPVSFLACMNLLVFFLPNESGEKASFSITLFLSVAVFMTIIMDQLPQVSTEIPNASIILCLHLANHSLVCMFTVVSLWAHHRDKNVDIPDCLNKITKRMIGYKRKFKLCCKTKKQSEENMSQWAEQEPPNTTRPDHTRQHRYVVSAAVSEPPGTLITWQTVSQAIDFYTLIFCLVLSAIELIFMVTICFT